ncbi:MAG TPA: cysteine--tRNA ligase [Candidatus Dormibacteraeota bacterium]|jgi:L-cysteine:1D-myo-inositol 2-amino-2-deoxy-alpha-D-glucopyranoside ligase|nr:cysteine--tRNA ligase [Candidatus Dormibacteraeota bacterium]
MQLYDTAARTVRPLEPAGDPVTLYVCGITPYDAAHLGHAFTYHVFDVITRRLLAAGRGVRSVRNVTDIDDDIFRVARERGVDARALVAFQVSRFDMEMASIDILPVTVPYASAHVPEMVDWIARLEAAGFAYPRDGRVYFDTARFDRYGRLSGLDRERMIALSRERGADPDDPRKRDPLDFILWQPSLSDEPHWPSPWGDGRPGWHIECSVIATHELGATVDVHGGGDDLVYPHHESEIAQTEALQDGPLARHWVHVAMVQLDGVKMSKSLGNLVFVRDLVAKAPPGAARLVLAAHHYRTAWSYTEDDLDTARERYHTWRRAFTGDERLDPEEAAAAEREFFERLDDDLDTPGALRVLDRIATEGSRSQAAGGIPAVPLMARLSGVIGVELDRVVTLPLTEPRRAS